MMMSKQKKTLKRSLRTVFACLMILIEIVFKDVSVRRLINPHEVIYINYRYFSLAALRHGLYFPIMIAGLSACYFISVLIECGNRMIRIAMIVILVAIAVLLMIVSAGSIVTWTGPVLLLLDILGLIITVRMIKEGN